MEEFRSELSFWKEIESTQDDLFEEIERLDDKMGFVLWEIRESGKRRNSGNLGRELENLSEEIRALKKNS